MKNRIRKFREKKGLSQRQLAQLLGTSQQQIQRYEVGNSPVRMDIAMHLTAVLGVGANELFPGIRAPFAKLRKQGGVPNRADVDKALRAGGVETDPTLWTVDMTLRGGMRRHYRISVADKDRLKRDLQTLSFDEKDDSPFFWFESTDYSVTVNLEHVLACQILFDFHLSETETKMEESSENVRVWLTPSAEPLTYRVEPNEERDEAGLLPFEADFLVHLDGPVQVLRFVNFEDEDGETAYFQTKDIILVEAALEICIRTAIIKLMKKPTKTRAKIQPQKIRQRHRGWPTLPRVFS